MREFKFRIWNGRKMIFGPTDDNQNSSWILAISETINYPLQQYTGVKDKNGKEIYEGDLIKYRDRIGRVDFFAAMFICSWDDQTDEELGYMMINEMEVVGNIFEK